MQIFKLFGSIFVDNDKANKSISETDKKAEGLGNRFTDGAKKIGKFGLAVGGVAVAAGGAIGKLAYETGEMADRLLDLQSVTGMTTDELQRWERVATVAGVSSEAIANVSQKLTKQMDLLESGTGKAAEALAALGIEFDDLEAADADTRVNMIVDALMAIEDPTERARVGTDLLGSAWEDLAPILDLGADKLNEVKENADIISEDDLSMANDFRIKVDEMKESIGLFGTKIALEVLPVLLNLFEKLEEKGPALQTIFGILVTILESALDVALELVDALVDVINTSAEAFEAVTGIKVGSVPGTGENPGFWSKINEWNKRFIGETIKSPFNPLGNLIESFKTDEESIAPVIDGNSLNFMRQGTTAEQASININVEGATFINEQGLEDFTDKMVDMLSSKGVQTWA